MKTILAALLVCSLGLPMAAMADYTIKPGKWKVTITMEMPGMPFTPPPRTFRQCVSAKQASSSMKQQMQKTQKSGCTMKTFDFSKGKGHWKVDCKGDHAASGEGWVTLNSDKTHYTTKSKIDLHDSGGGTMTINGEANWVGNCTP